MALVGNEVLFVQGVQTNGKLSPITQQTTVGAIAALAGEFSGDSVVAITTVGAGTLTAASLVAGVINRSGPTSAYTDTTATAALIYAAVGSIVGGSFYVWIKNTTAFAQTLAGGTGVTFSGSTVVPQNSAALFLVTVTSATASAFNHVVTVPLTVTPPQALIGTADNGTTQTLTAAMVAGANSVYHVSTGGTTPSLTMPLATDIIASMPNWHVGQSYMLRIINSNSGTATMVTNTGITMSGTLTVATNTTRDFVITMATATTVTMTNVGTGTNS